MAKRIWLATIFPNTYTPTKAEGFLLDRIASVVVYPDPTGRGHTGIVVNSVREYDCYINVNGVERQFHSPARHISDPPLDGREAISFL